LCLLAEDNDKKIIIIFENEKHNKLTKLLAVTLFSVSLNAFKTFAMTIFHKITKSEKLVILLIIPTYAKASFYYP
jgi:hypothetical protein